LGIRILGKLKKTSWGIGAGFNRKEVGLERPKFYCGKLKGRGKGKFT